MNTKPLNERFEEAYLAGRDPKNPMVACLITKYVGHEEYSNPHTQAMFEMFLKGRQDAGAELQQVVDYMNEGCICGRAPQPKHPVDKRLLVKGKAVQS